MSGSAGTTIDQDSLTNSARLRSQATRETLSRSSSSLGPLGRTGGGADSGPLGLGGSLGFDGAFGFGFLRLFLRERFGDFVDVDDPVWAGDGGVPSPGEEEGVEGSLPVDDADTDKAASGSGALSGALTSTAHRDDQLARVDRHADRVVPLQLVIVDHE
jgi:hypothetical protein